MHIFPFDSDWSTLSGFRFDKNKSGVALPVFPLHLPSKTQKAAKKTVRATAFIIIHHFSLFFIRVLNRDHATAQFLTTAAGGRRVAAAALMERSAMKDVQPAGAGYLCENN